MVIEVRDLHFAYHDREVLRGITLSLHSGEFLGLLGPNGSGKSTFLKILLGYLPPKAPQGGGGEAEPISFIFSTSPGGIEEKMGKAWGSAQRGPRGKGPAAPLLAFVPQRPGLAMSLPVREMVLMGRLPHLRSRWAGYDAGDRRKAEAVLSALGIEELADRDMNTLSGGESQKVIIARCLVQEGEFLLLDEVTSGLDLNHTIEIMELMRRKTDEEGKGIVAVFHDLNLAAQYCDRLVFFKDGELRGQGKPGEVLTGDLVEEIYGIRPLILQGKDGKPLVLPRRA